MLREIRHSCLCKTVKASTSHFMQMTFYTIKDVSFIKCHGHITPGGRLATGSIQPQLLVQYRHILCCGGQLLIGSKTLKCTPGDTFKQA